MKLGQTLLTSSILIGAGTYKTYTDYKTAPKEQKNRTLIRNTMTLGAAALGIYYTNDIITKKFNSSSVQKFFSQISEKILKSKFIKKFHNKFFKYKYITDINKNALAEIISNCTKDISFTIVAGLSGISIGYLLDKLLHKKAKKEMSKNIQDSPGKSQEIYNQYFSHFPKSISEVMDNQIINNKTNKHASVLIKNTAKVFETAGFVFNPFEMPAKVLDSMDYAKEKNIKKLIEQTSGGIVAEALIPTTIVSITNSITKNKNLKIKLPSLLAAFYIGDYLGNLVGKKLTKEIKTNPKTSN